MSERDTLVLTELMDLQEPEHDLIATGLIAGAVLTTLAMMVGLSFFG